MPQQARVGILVLIGAAMFFITLFVIADRGFLLQRTFELRAEFNNVAGLQSGAPVHFHGIAVGRVRRIELPQRPGGKISVTIALSNAARHLVREGTQAQIKTEGLVGNQIIVLIAGPETAPVIREGDLIVGVDPFDLFQLTDDMMLVVARYDTAAVTLVEIMRDVQRGEGTLGRFLYDPSAYETFLNVSVEAQRFMQTLSSEVAAVVGLAREATTGVSSIIERIESGDGTIAQLLNDPSVYDALLATSDTLRAIAGDTRAITSQTENAVNWATLGMFRFAENMEALKHNWLFRGYFERRGFYERAPFEIRERAISESFERLEARQRELYELEQSLRQREERLDREGLPELPTVQHVDSEEEGDE